MNYIHILEPDSFSLEALRILGKIGPITKGIPDETIIGRITVLYVRLQTYLDHRILSDYLSLQYIVSPTTGLAHIDEKYCHARGIKIINLQSCRESLHSITATSELALYMIIDMLRGFTNARNDVAKNGCWNRDKHVSNQLRHFHVGFLGFGRVAKNIAPSRSAFGVSMAACDPYVEREVFDEYGVQQMSLYQLVQSIDLLSVNCSLTNETRKLVNNTLLTTMVRRLYC